jgi:chromosome segregation ATPase
MSELINSISRLDSLVDALLKRLEETKNERLNLEKELRELRSRFADEQKKLRECEEELKALRLANGLLGGDNRTEAKLKINTLIREIDHCIAQLSE